MSSFSSSQNPAAATSEHPPTSTITDPTIAQTHQEDGHPTGQFSAPTTARSAELSRLTLSLRKALRQFPDFPSPGILFEDIMPIFFDPGLHSALIRALELHVREAYGDSNKPDVIVGLEARGFLFGPSLALQIGAAFVPVRKKGKLPGPTVEATYQKEYGADLFQLQADAIKPGQKVLIVDDIIATGGSAAAAGNLVKQLGGQTLGYCFILELDFLKGREKLDAPVYTLLSSQEGDGK